MMCLYIIVVIHWTNKIVRYSIEGTVRTKLMQRLGKMIEMYVVCHVSEKIINTILLIISNSKAILCDTSKAEYK